MVVRGMILARAFPVAITQRPVTVNQDMKALVPGDSRLADYLLLALRALEPQALSTVERSTHGTCRLEFSVIESLVVALPPLAEQRRIVAKVDELMALCDRLEARLTAAREKSAHLAASVVHHLTAA
jgi:type I restriction enzyme S subunit